MRQLLFYLKVSRPGLWFPTIWLYLMPLGGTEFWQEPIFWIGLAYVLFPMNFMVYGWNDYVDFEADQLNPRKDSFWFGARGSKAQLTAMIPALVIIQVLTYPFFIYWAGWPVLVIYSAQLLILWAYNFPGKGLRSMPPFEMLCQFGYLLVVPFSIFINETSGLPWQTYVYLSAFAIQAHLMGEVMDIEPDRKAGKTTTATVIGRLNTKFLIMGLVLGEALWVLFIFEDIWFSGMLFAALAWLFLDAFLIFKNKQYSMTEMKLFAVASNLMAMVSMGYILYSGCLLSLP